MATINPITGKTNEQVMAETNALVAKAKAMLEQTKVEGAKPFTGSTYETQYKASYPNYSPPSAPIVPASSSANVSPYFQAGTAVDAGTDPMKRAYNSLVAQGASVGGYDDWLSKRIQAAKVPSYSGDANDPNIKKLLDALWGGLGNEYHSQDLADIVNNPSGTKAVSGPGVTSGMTSDEVMKALQTWSSSQPDAMAGLKDQIQKLIDAQTKYQSDIATAKTTSGVGPAQEAVTKTTQMLDALEENINQRISGSGMLESQRQRQYAVEQKPLAKTLGTQTNALNLAQQNYQEQVNQAGVPMELTKSLLPIYQSMANYQSPQQKLTDMIAQESLLKTLGLGDYAKTTTPTTTTDYSNWQLAGGKAGTGMDYSTWLDRNKSTSGSNLTINQKIDAEMSLYSKVQAANKLQLEVVRNVNGVNAMWSDFMKDPNQSLNAISQAIITSYGKILDPGSVVRESEYARTPEGLSLLSQAQGTLDKMVSGGAGLTTNNLREFINAINVLGTNAQTEINKQIETAKAYGTQYGLDTSLITGNTQTIGGGPNSDPIVELEDDINKLANTPEYKRDWGREQLIEDLYAEYKNELTKQQIIDKVYGITKKLWGN